MKNWVKASQVTIFKLKNNIYQAIFQDKSEIFMNSSSKDMIFVDKNRKKLYIKIDSEEVTQNRSLNVRIEYFKKVLRKWVGKDGKRIKGKITN